MAGISRVDFRQLKQFKRNIDKLDAAAVERLASKIIKQQAALFLRNVIEVTPVGSYTDGRVGGTLRRGWTTRDINVTKLGNVYQVEIINGVEYASYVNNGHRTRNGGFVNGQFFLEIAESQVERKTPALVAKNVEAALRGAFNGN